MIHDFYTLSFLTLVPQYTVCFTGILLRVPKVQGKGLLLFEVSPFQISLALALPVPTDLLWICLYSFYRLPLYKETAFCSNTALQRREIKAIIEFLLKCSGEETETHPFLSQLQETKLQMYFCMCHKHVYLMIPTICWCKPIS